MGKKIYVIPDTQSKPNVYNPLIPIAYHISEIKPDYIIHLGDHWDFPSLSQYDKGKKSHRAKTYMKDCNAGNESMAEFFEILDEEWPEHRIVCEKIILRGNHEHRRDRALEYGPDELIDLMELVTPDYTGWDKVVPFLKIHKIEGINFCHFFQQDASDRPISKPQQLLSKRHGSCIAGHKQGFEYSESITVDGKRIQAIIAGSCYYHDEGYKGHTNHHWRGSMLLYNCKSGEFDFSIHSLSALDKRYCE